MSPIHKLSPGEAARAIAITTTVPVEIIFAAGLRPLDLNNLFITSGIAPQLVEEAEQAGFPRNSCSWNKGIFSAARQLGIKQIAAVVQGDCANTHALVEMLRLEGVETVPFAFPYDPSDRATLESALKKFCKALGASYSDAQKWKARLDPLRALAHRIDDLCWRAGKATGWEQHYWTISCSDFLGNPEEFSALAAGKIAEIESREPDSRSLHLALIGIPPICGGFFEFLEDKGARVIFNEIPRQFAMPHPTHDLIEQYSRYTYPYDIFYRLRDIKKELAKRRPDGVIHYVQSFCFRQVQDRIIRRELSLPILTLECDRPGPLDMRTQTRIEAFLEMLRARRKPLKRGE